VGIGVGENDGAKVGFGVGAVGDRVGFKVGEGVGANDGAKVGLKVGAREGDCVGF
jgi:tetrahydromethanopterin S-methyltransferase subunit G